MNNLVTAYLILGATMIVALGIVILKVAGQDLFFALARWFNPRKCDVFVVNGNRHVDRHYLLPKDGVFKINNKIYITNPNKLEGLSDEMVKEVKLRLNQGIQRLEKLIGKLELKKSVVVKQIDSIEAKEENLPILEQLKMQLADLDNKIELLVSKKEKREFSYSMRRRGAYFYIEDDPVPKDFFEFYTEMDCIQLENIIIRAQTKDPKDMRKMEKDIVFIKKFVIIAVGAAAIACFLAYRNSSMIKQIGQHLHVVFTM